jgi:hypothetical protein
MVMVLGHKIGCKVDIHPLLRQLTWVVSLQLFGRPQNIIHFETFNIPYYFIVYSLTCSILVLEI